LVASAVVKQLKGTAVRAVFPTVAVVEVAGLIVAVDVAVRVAKHRVAAVRSTDCWTVLAVIEVVVAPVSLTARVAAPIAQLSP
jgi:hypothetical protein